MRQLSTEVESGQLGGGGRNVPTIQGHTPSDAQITQGVIQADGNAQMQYNQQMAQIGTQILAQKQNGLDRLAATDSLIGINAAMKQAGEEYLKANRSGEGYQSFMTGKYKELADDSIAQAPNNEVKQMLQLHTKAGLLDTYISSYDKEKEVDISYKGSHVEENAQTTLNQLYIDPAKVASLRLQFLDVIAPMQEIAPTEFEGYKRQQLNRFARTYVSGLINKDPAGTVRLLQKEKVDDLKEEDRNTLLHHAIKEVDRRQAHARAEKEAAEKIRHEQQTVNYVTVEDKINAGQITSEAEIDQVDLGRVQHAHALKYLHDFQREQANKRHTQREMGERLQNGEPLVGYSAEQVNSFYRDHIRQKREGNPDVPVTFMDKVRLGESLKSDHSINDLVVDLSKGMEDGSPTDVFNASMAIQYALDKNPKMIDDLDKKYVYMSSYVRSNTIFEGTVLKNIDKIAQRARETFLKNQDKADMENNKIAFNKYMTTHNYNPITKELSNIPDNYKSAAFTDARRFLEEAFMAGARDSEAMNIAKEQIQREYSSTNLNGKPGSKWFNSTASFMKHAPERVYPQYQGTHFLRNSMYSDIQTIVQENERTFGEHSDVKLMKPLVKKYKVKEDWHKENLTAMEIPKILVKVDGKWVERQVFIEWAEGTVGKYNLFWLSEEGNFLTKHPLKFSNQAFAAEIGF
jgi:hypothetical protein